MLYFKLWFNNKYVMTKSKDYSKNIKNNKIACKIIRAINTFSILIRYQYAADYLKLLTLSYLLTLVTYIRYLPGQMCTVLIPYRSIVSQNGIAVNPLGAASYCCTVNTQAYQKVSGVCVANENFLGRVGKFFLHFSA